MLKHLRHLETIASLHLIFLSSKHDYVKSLAMIKVAVPFESRYPVSMPGHTWIQIKDLSKSKLWNPDSKSFRQTTDRCSSKKTRPTWPELGNTCIIYLYLSAICLSSFIRLHVLCHWVGGSSLQVWNKLTWRGTSLIKDYGSWKSSSHQIQIHWVPVHRANAFQMPARFDSWRQIWCSKGSQLHRCLREQHGWGKARVKAMVVAIVAGDNQSHCSQNQPALAQ